jgi:hypothetical protein
VGVVVVQSGPPVVFNIVVWRAVTRVPFQLVCFLNQNEAFSSWISGLMRGFASRKGVGRRTVGVIGNNKLPIMDCNFSEKSHRFRPSLDNRLKIREY